MSSAAAPSGAPDLKHLSAAHVACSHPFALAAMTQIVVPKPGSDDLDSEILEGEALPFNLWPHQRLIINLALKRRRVIVLKARQLGVTWVLALLALWYAMSHPAAEVVIVSVGKREAAKVGRRVRWLYNHLPDAVKQAFPIGSDDTIEVFSIGHADGQSTITSLPSSATAGRGETVNLLLLDEGAHWEQAEDRLASLLPTVEDVGQVVLASTANGVGGTFYRTWMASPENGFHKLFVKADSRPDRNEVWVMNARRRVGEKGIQEYPMTPNEAFISSGNCVFDTAALQDYLDNRVRPAARRGWLEVENGQVRFAPDDLHGAWRIWRWREEGRQYLITADVCGGGGGRDYSAAAVYDLESWDQVAAFWGRPEPEFFAYLLIRAGWMWRGQEGMPALLAPEVNDHGRAVIAVLRERNYRNLWAMARYDQRRDTRVQEYGWLTSPASRPVMLATLKHALREGDLGVVDNMAIGECLTFETNPVTGKEEAREGENDDRVMTHAIAATVLIREASDARPRRPRPADLAPYRRPQSSRTGY